MRQRKRTKKAYKDLFDQPENLVNGKSGKAEVILFPNGGRVIWTPKIRGAHFGSLLTARGAHHG